jgi:hypothetical protein
MVTFMVWPAHKLTWQSPWSIGLVAVTTPHAPDATMSLEGARGFGGGLGGGGLGGDGGVGGLGGGGGLGGELQLPSR